LGQLLLHGPTLFHDLARHAHLRFEFGVVGGDAQAIRRFRYLQLIALGTDGIANLGEF